MASLNCDNCSLRGTVRAIGWWLDRNCGEIWSFFGVCICDETRDYESYKWLTLKPATLATESGFDVGHGYCRTEIHRHRDENEDRREAPGPYRVVEEQRFRLDSPVRALVHVMTYQQPSLDAHHVQPEEAGHERELDDECWKWRRPQVSQSICLSSACRHTS